MHHIDTRKTRPNKFLTPVSFIMTRTSFIKEPNKTEIRLRNSDIAKFGTRHERETELGQNIERRPKNNHETTPEKRSFVERSREQEN